MIKTKRVYEEPASDDGFRVLVDRIWPRGVRKDEAKVDLWLKEIAPSSELRKWFGHEADRWSEFRKRYFEELKQHSDLVEKVRRESDRRDVTLLFAAKDTERNNAVALREFLSKRPWKA